jgi:aspartate kinase
VRALQAVHAAFGLGGSVQHRAEGTEAPEQALRPAPPASDAAP